MFQKNQRYIICLDIGMSHNLKHSLMVLYFLSLRKGKKRIEVSKPRNCPKALE